MTPPNLPFLKINIGYLLKEGAGYTRDIDLHRDEPLRLDDIEIQYLDGILHLSRTPQGIVAQGTISGAVMTTCVRCLESFPSPFSFSLSELFVTDHSIIGADDVFLIDDGNAIDLSPIVREEAILAVPMHAVCREDCQGLCQNCGQNLNEKDCGCEEDTSDPRFAALRNLLKE